MGTGAVLVVHIDGDIDLTDALRCGTLEVRQ